jgi:hypothetical protein
MAAFTRVWTGIRDVATWGLGALWGHALMTAPGPADPTKAVLVAALLGLPFVFRADELRRTDRETSSLSRTNGVVPEPQDSTTA